MQARDGPTPNRRFTRLACHRPIDDAVHQEFR
jgi:hypothetical protein